MVEYNLDSKFSSLIYKGCRARDSNVRSKMVRSTIRSSEIGLNSLGEVGMRRMNLSLHPTAGYKTSTEGKGS